jgi:ribosomal protein S18 acetylase RimI-like enzyme
MRVTIVKGLRPDQRAEAAALYWQAFGDKLGRVLGPDRRAIALLTRVIRDDHALCAQGEQGALLGIAGFKTRDGAFADADRADLVAVYGRFGGYWRRHLLALLIRDEDNERFLIDGICVAKALRGQGIGTALLAALCDEGRKRGHGGIRLDVVETNTRARALYLRQGFTVLRTDRMGLLGPIFGFKAAIAMAKPLGPA